MASSEPAVSPAGSPSASPISSEQLSSGSGVITPRIGSLPRLSSSRSSSPSRTVGESASTSPSEILVGE